MCTFSEFCCLHCSIACYQTRLSAARCDVDVFCMTSCFPIMNRRESKTTHNVSSSSPGGGTGAKSGVPDRILLRYYFASGRGCKVSVCMSVCLSACISQKAHVQSATNFPNTLPVAVAWSSSDGIETHYVLPVLCVTSFLHII